MELVHERGRAERQGLGLPGAHSARILSLCGLLPETVIDRDGEWLCAGVGAAGVSGGRQHIDDGLEGRVVAAPALAGVNMKRSRFLPSIL